MTEEDEAFEELSRRQGDWGLQGSRKHQIMRYLENDAMREVQRLGQEIEPKIGCVNHDCDQCKAQPDQYAKGYADAMNWKVQNHLEHLPAAQNLADWKLVPREPTREMLEAMDECSIEGYDEHLYAGHAASVYMAAVDVAPTPPQPKEPEQEPVALREALASALTSVYVCDRVWSAWGVGTMTQDDFYPAAESDDVLDSLVQAVISATPPPPQRKPLTDEQIESLLMNWPEDGIAFFEFARAIEAAHGIKENT